MWTRGADRWWGLGVAWRQLSDIRSIQVILRNLDSRTYTVAGRQVILVHVLNCDERFGVESCGREMDSSQIPPMFPFLSAFNNVQSKLWGPQTKFWKSSKLREFKKDQRANILPQRMIPVCSINIPKNRLIANISVIKQNIAVYWKISVDQLSGEKIRRGFNQPEVWST